MLFEEAIEVNVLRVGTSTHLFGQDGFARTLWTYYENGLRSKHILGFLVYLGSIQGSVDGPHLAKGLVVFKHWHGVVNVVVDSFLNGVRGVVYALTVFASLLQIFAHLFVCDVVVDDQLNFADLLLKMLALVDSSREPINHVVFGLNAGHLSHQALDDNFVRDDTSVTHELLDAVSFLGAFDHLRPQEISRAQVAEPKLFN
jgi:hypothetical protein